MRCNDCAKFTGLETVIDDSEVDVTLGDFHEDGKSVECEDAEVHVQRQCADCGTELKSLDFRVEFNDPIKLSRKVKEKEREECTATLEDIEPSESGGGRYQKNMVGFTAKLVIKDGKGKVLGEQDVDMAEPAGAFEEC